MLPRRFVILHHLAPTGEHWDLMIEHGDILLTWQLSAEPVNREACPIECTRIKDHRKHYLDYEGPVSGGRGMVTRVDQGRCEMLSSTDDAIALEFAGRRLTGQFRLTRPDPNSQSRWTLDAM